MKALEGDNMNHRTGFPAFETLKENAKKKLVALQDR